MTPIKESQQWEMAARELMDAIEIAADKPARERIPYLREVAARHGNPRDIYAFIKAQHAVTLQQYHNNRQAAESALCDIEHQQEQERAQHAALLAESSTMTLHLLICMQDLIADFDVRVDMRSELKVTMEEATVFLARLNREGETK